MKLGFPSPVYRPMAKLSVHELSAHGVEAEVVNEIVGSVVIEGCEVMGSAARVGGSSPDPVIEVPDGVNLLKAHLSSFIWGLGELISHYPLPLSVAPSADALYTDHHANRTSQEAPT